MRRIPRLKIIALATILALLLNGLVATASTVAPALQPVALAHGSNCYWADSHITWVCKNGTWHMNQWQHRWCYQPGVGWHCGHGERSIGLINTGIPCSQPHPDAVEYLFNSMEAQQESLSRAGPPE
jgi:hypothetical protein